MEQEEQDDDREIEMQGGWEAEEEGRGEQEE